MAAPLTPRRDCAPNVIRWPGVRGRKNKRLQTSIVLQRMLDRMDESRQALADSLRYVSTLGKRPALAAYEMAKVHAQHDPADAKLVNPAVDL